MIRYNRNVSARLTRRYVQSMSYVSQKTWCIFLSIISNISHVLRVSILLDTALLLAKYGSIKYSVQLGYVLHVALLHIRYSAVKYQIRLTSVSDMTLLSIRYWSVKYLDSTTCRLVSSHWWSFHRRTRLVPTSFDFVYAVQQDTQCGLMSKFYSALYVSCTCFGPHRSTIRSVFYKLYLQTWYVVIRVPLDTSNRYKVLPTTL